MIPASNNMKNTEWAVAIFKDFAIRSLDIQGRFQFGGSDEINSIMEEFPYMYVQANDIRVTPNGDGKSGYASMETTFEVTIADKLLSSKDNELQTVSDSQEIMLAVISELSTHPYYVANQMRMVGDAIITTRYEADDAIVSKVTAEITLRYPFRYTYCNQPVDNIPFYPTITTDIFGSVTQSICTLIEGCPVIINIQNDIIDLQNQIDEFISTTKTLISGGAEWSGVGLTFSVSELTYTFNGPLLSAGPVDIQLNVGDPTYSRIDAIVVDEAGVISVIEGTPSPDPATPPIPDEQLLVQFVIVGAGATTPSITQEYIYLDNNEWTTTTYQTSGAVFGTVSFTSTIPTPFQGIYCINAQSDSRTGLRFTRFSNIDVSQYSILSLRVWFNASFLTSRSLQASLFLGNIQQGVTVNLNTLGLNRNVLNQWQQVLIPVASFGSVTNINRLQIRMVGGTSNVVIQYAVDFIQLQTGIAPPQPQTQIVIQKNGSNVGSRPRINFIEGSGLSITAADDIVNDRVNLTLSVSGGGGSGSQGFTGPQGLTGPQGETGPQGFQGPSGVDGFLGGTGPQGFTGNQGETGPQGFQGPSGVDGFLGGTGPQGFTGNQGEAGPQGYTGPQGSPGFSTGLVYYFNPSNSTDITGYFEMDRDIVIGLGTTKTATGAGDQLIEEFITIIGDPGVTNIPSGAWNFEQYVSMSSNGGTPLIYVDIFVRDLSGTETLIGSNTSAPHPIDLGVLTELYLFSVAIPTTTILLTDRIVVKFYARNLGGKTMTCYFEDNRISQATTSLSPALQGAQGLTGPQGPIGPTGSIPSGLFLPLAGSTASSKMQGLIEANGGITFDILQRSAPTAVQIRMNSSNSIVMFNGDVNRSTGIEFGSTDPDYWDLSGKSFITNKAPTLRSKCGNIELTGIGGSQYIFGGSFSGKKQGIFLDHGSKGVGVGNSLTIFQTDDNTDFGIINVRNNQVIMGSGTSLTASNQFEFQLDKCNFIIGSHSETNTNCSTIITGYGHSFGDTNNSSIIGGLNNTLTGKNKGSSIIGGSQNILDSGRYNTIIGSQDSNVYLSYGNTITSSFRSTIDNKSSNSLISSSSRSNINRGSYSSIISSRSSNIDNGGTTIESSVILASAGSSIKSNYSAIIASPNSNIGAGYKNFIGGGSGQYNYGYDGAILGGAGNQIGANQYRGAIIGGYGNVISTNYGLGCNSTIIGGYQNVMKGACNSAIIGGQSLSLYNSDTVLVPNLWISGTVSPNNGVEFGTSGTFFIGSATFSICNGIITNIIQ